MNVDHKALSTESKRRLLASGYQQSFLAFAMRSFAILDQSKPLVMAPHIDAICHALERLYHGDIRRLIITVPPRHGKSHLASIAFPAWVMGQNPSLKFMVASYGLELSSEHVANARKLIGSPEYQSIFPKTAVRFGKDKHSIFGTTRGGGYRAVSQKGPVTGFGANIITVDDLHKADEALTPTRREEAFRFFQNSLASRFDDPANARFLVIQQRLHEYDIVGYLLEQGGWHHLNLPAIAEKDEDIPLSGGQIWHRKKGDLLDPVRFPKSYLEQQQVLLGNRSYAAQYQGNPIASDGNYLDWDWFGQYDVAPPRSAFHRIVQSVDTASTDNILSDYSVIMTWGYQDPDWYLLDVFRAKPRFPELVDRVVSAHKRWRADALIIEAANSGHSLWQTIKDNRLLSGQVTCQTPTMGKIERAIGRTAQMAKGNFLLPVDAPWLDDLRHEVISFPDGRHDDMVDAMVQFMEFISPRQRWVKARVGPDGRRESVSRKDRLRRDMEDWASAGET